MIRHQKFIIIAGMWLTCLLLSAEAQADERLEKIKIPQALYAGLHHFLDLADPDKTVAIYDEVDPVTAKVRCAMFKWLRAGWSGINMVRRRHIYNGLKRFAKPVKEILEYPSLPSAESMAGVFSRIRGFPEDSLRSKMKIYSGILQNRYDGGKGHAKKLPSFLFKNKNHWAQMSKDEMESALVIEYMKYAVGKTRPDEVSALLGLKR